MSADLYFTRDSSFFRRLISEVAERNSTKIGHLSLQIASRRKPFLDDFAT